MCPGTYPVATESRRKMISAAQLRESCLASAIYVTARLYAIDVSTFRSLNDQLAFGMGNVNLFPDSLCFPQVT